MSGSEECYVLSSLCDVIPNVCVCVCVCVCARVLLIVIRWSSNLLYIYNENVDECRLGKKERKKHTTFCIHVILPVDG